MADLTFNMFPGGRKKALTMSYDDGREYDRRLVEIFNRHQIKGTFHLNSGKFGTPGYISAEEVAPLYAGHEVSAHTVHHYDPNTLPNAVLIHEIQEDRRTLESLVGCPVRGMSYPYGNYNEEVLKVLSSLGIEYSRTVRTTKRFWVNPDFLQWAGTCHHNDNLMELGKQFLADTRYWSYSLMYVWGHSYEFENDHNWELIEEFCTLMGGRDDIWYATNIEIVDYINASKNLRFSVDQSTVFNPSALDVIIGVNGEPVRVPSGKCVRL